MTVETQQEFNEKQEMVMDVVLRVWRRYRDFVLSKGIHWRKYLYWLCMKQFLPPRLQVYLTNETIESFPSFEDCPRAFRKLIELRIITDVPEWARNVRGRLEKLYRTFYRKDEWTQ